MEDRTRRSAVLMILDIFLQFLPGFMMYHCAASAGEILLELEGCFSLWNGLWLFLLMAGFYLFRYYFPEFRLFLISHLIWLTVFCVILPRTTFAKVVLTIIGIFRGLYGSIQKASRVNERGEKIDLNKVDVEATEPLEGCVALFSLAVALFAGDIAVIYPFMAEPVIFYLLYFLRTHLSGRRLYLAQYEHMSHFPMRHMRQTGYLVMGAYLLFCLICLTVAASYRYFLSETGPFIWLWERVKQIIRFLVMAFIRLIDIFMPDIHVENVEESAGTAPALFLGEPTETSAFWMLLDQIVRIGIFVILVVLLAVGVVYILMEWNRRFQKGRGRGDQTEEYEEIRETWKKREKQVRKRRPGILFRTPEEKIRWIYIRAVRNVTGTDRRHPDDADGELHIEGRLGRYRKKRMQVDETLSPLELDQVIELNQAVADEETLRTLYERARYSGQSADKDMVLQAKAAARSKSVG